MDFCTYHWSTRGVLLGKKYDEALNGIVAEFDGVVSSLDVVEGASVQEGAQLNI